MTQEDVEATIAKISMAMLEDGLSQNFVAEAAALALKDEGALDLMALWEDNSDPSLRKNVVALLEDYGRVPVRA